ncbi:MAG: hypothetical protein K2N13_03515 [Paraprevotella sp.]|nr:hypothetical protein [Paraprevotella sp.]
MASIFFLCSLFSVAEDFVPVDGTKYMIRCMVTDGKKFVLFNDNCSNADDVKILSTWLQYDLRSFFLISGNATDGYTIRNAQNNFYVFAVNTNDEESNVGLKEQTGETVDADCLWKIVQNGSGWNIIPKEGQNGWNCRGDLNGNGCVGQWSQNNTDDNRWQILSPADMGILIESEKASVIGFPVLSDEIRASIVAAGDALNENLTQENLTAFNSAINSPSDNHLYLPTGYYQMKSVASARREYLYNDYLLEANAHNLTLQSEAPETLTNNYIWHVTNNGTSIDLINGQGTFIKPSSSGNGVGETYPTLNFDNYINGKQGIYFTEGINCCNGNPFLLSDGTHHLTTWADHPNADDNRWLFDAVDESNLYTLTIEGLTEPTISNTYLTRTSTGEIAFNGGFFVLETAPSAADFDVPDVENHNKTVTIEGNSITVTYTPNVKLVSHAVRVNALSQLKTGSKIVIRNDGSNAGRTGFVHESGDNLLIDNTAIDLTNLTYDYVFTVSDYASSTGTCYLTAHSGRKIAGAYPTGGIPMKTVDEPEGMITLLTEGANHWDLKYGSNGYFNVNDNNTYGSFLNTWTVQTDANASWEIFLVDDEDMFQPVEGAVYYIDCVYTNKGRAVYLPGATALGITADADALHLGNLFTVEPVYGTYGEEYYHIKPYANPDEYVYYINTNSNDANVGITADANHANREWCITPSQAEDVSGFNILPKTGQNGWNCRGSESVWNTGAVGQYGFNATADNTWAFVTVDEEDIAVATETYKTAVRPPTLDRVGGVSLSAYEAALAELTDLKDFFMAPLTLCESLSLSLPLIKPTSASGLYRIKNNALQKYLYQEADEKNITFINDKSGENDDANSRYYYRVTFGEDNNEAEIVNSDGKPLARGNMNASYANANTVVVSPVTLTFCGRENYFLFPGTHSTAQAVYTKNNAAYDTDSNPYFLTTWTTTAEANQYTFEEVELPADTQVYNVIITGGSDDITITYTGEGYDGNATVYNGGFFVLGTVPSAADFDVPDVENHNKTITIEGNSIKVTYTMKINHAVRVNALNQLKTGSKIVIRNDGSNAGRTGFVHESGDNLLIDNTAIDLTNLTYDYVFTVSDYASSTGTCYLTAHSGRKIAGAYPTGGIPMKTVDEPEGMITLLTEGANHWDLKYGSNGYFNVNDNNTYGSFLNTWTVQTDANASWEIFLVDDEDMFQPVEGAVYYIDCVRSDRGRTVCLPGATALGITADADALHLGNLFTVEPVDGTYGEEYYHIKSYANPDEYIYYINTDDANANVGITTDANHANREWCITPSRVGGNVSGFNILPKTGQNGWNCRGSESVWNTGAVGQYSQNATADNTWAFVTVDEEGVAAAVETYKTTVRRSSFWDKIGGVSSAAYEAALAELTALKEIYMAPQTLLESLPLIKPTSASGLYRIKNNALQKYLYQEADEKNITFINDKSGENDDANSRYYYRVTFGEDNNEAEIVNSDGKPLARGNMSASYANANTVVASPVTLAFCNVENYFLFPETHSTAQAVYTKNYAAYDTDSNPYFLTTWTATTANDQYTFEEVELPADTQVYNVIITGGSDDITITYTGEGYNGNATVYNGGFFILASAPTKEDLRSENEDYEVAGVEVNGTEVTVRLAALSATEEEKAQAREILELQGVGYPMIASEARSALETAIENARRKAELTAAVDAYKSVVTDIQMPEDGKAYTFTCVLKDGTRRYMDYTEDGYQLVTTEEADNSNYPVTATLICHRLEDGTYAFANNAGKYFMWKGSNAGHNGNKGYSDEWDGSWCPIMVSKILNADANVTAPGGQADLFGYMAVQGYRGLDNLNYFVAASHFENNSGYDQAGVAYYNDNYSSAIQIEETAYPNVVTLSDAGDIEGIASIGTFSAPFATLVPEGVTAYYVTTADGESSEAYTAPLGAGKAIPANTGVLLTRTDGDVPTTATMVPAAEEERAAINRNLLNHSAGVDKAIPEEENAYILTKRNNVVGFHHLKSGGNRTLKMNKSYLVVPGTVGEAASFTLKMIFGDETGIGSVSTAEDSPAPVYDLFGRRVMQVSKGGIYIRDGKKFIVK